MNKNDKIWFSVVVPLYNKKPHIADTLTSVLSQTYSNFELIVVNDASTDGSREIVEGFSDKRLEIVDRKEPGPGGYAARNCGIRHAKYKLIAFLDADDTWHPDFLKEMAAVIKEYPDAGFYSSGWVEKSDEQGEVLNSYSRQYGDKGSHRLHLDDFLYSYISKYGPVCSSAAVVNKRLIESAGGFPENRCRFGGDIDTWLRIMLEGDSLVVNPHPLATYNREAVNMVTKNNALNVIETCVKKTAESLDEFRNTKKSKLFKRFVNHFQYLQVKKKAMAGTLEMRDLRYIYKWVNPIKYATFLMFSILHFSFQKKIVQIYTSLK